MLDNRPRYYATCPAGHGMTLIGNWHGPRPVGAVACPSCPAQINFSTFRFAFKGARWAARFYASLATKERI